MCVSRLLIFGVKLDDGPGDFVAVLSNCESVTVEVEKGWEDFWGDYDGRPANGADFIAMDVMVLASSILAVPDCSRVKHYSIVSRLRHGSNFFVRARTRCVSFEISPNLVTQYANETFSF